MIMVIYISFYFMSSFVVFLVSFPFSMFRFDFISFRVNFTSFCLVSVQLGKPFVNEVEVIPNSLII